MKKHRKIEGTPKNVTITREDGKWYASICIEFVPKALPKTKRKIGLDTGSVRLYTRSDGKVRKSFRFLPSIKELILKAKHIQKKLSWKFECWKSRESKTKLGKGEIVSNSWLKLKLTFRKIQSKIKRIKLDLLHKASFNLVKKFDLISVEDLKLKNMTKASKGTLEKPGKNVKQKSGLNRNLLSNSISTLYQMLEYKARWYGKKLVRVNPKHTSQTCSKCGKKDKESRKSQSVFVCTSCNFELNADWNAARNILARAEV
jgi:putative transposase